MALKQHQGCISLCLCVFVVNDVCFGLQEIHNWRGSFRLYVYVFVIIYGQFF